MTIKKINQHKYWMMKSNDNKIAEIDIDGEITSATWDESDTSAASFRDDLKELDDVKTINLHINSPGGSVFEGIAIYNMLKQHKAHINTYVDGIAASIASIIAMAGDTIFMPSNSMLMIHNPSTVAMGHSDELRKVADQLDKITNSIIDIYLDKANKLDKDNLIKMLDDETWISAEEAVNYGLADELLESNNAAACISNKYEKIYKHIPSSLLETTALAISEDEREKIVNESQKHKQLIQNTLGGIL